MASPSARPIRSYVLRQGRTTPAQRRALDELLPKYGIALSSTTISSARGAPLVLEIGSGMGETTVAIAKAHPEITAHFYAGAGHGFNCDQRGSYNAGAAKTARERTLEFFRKHVG